MSPSPRDKCLDLLISALEPESRILWLAGEGQEAALTALQNHTNLHLLSNRYDIVEHSQKLGLEASFSDWDLASDTEYDCVYCRLVKEKPVNLHWAALAAKHLKTGGRFYVCGQKNEGIKNFAKQLADSFQTVQPLTKHGDSYIAVFEQSGAPANTLESDYGKLQSVAARNFTPFLSKPGVYGWNKVDAGSALLIETLAPLAVQFSGKHMLDLGCGYGYLTIASRHWPFASRTATDNSAGAITCMRANAEHYQIDVDTRAGNCANTVDRQFDVILCNPPFHTAFDVDGGLTERFLDACRGKLTRGGTAYLVVNSFIPIEKKAVKAFFEVTLLANNGKFKVVALNKPRP